MHWTLARRNRVRRAFCLTVLLLMLAGCSPSLTELAKKGDVGAVKELLDGGTESDLLGCSESLEYNAAYGSTEMVRTLIDGCADRYRFESLLSWGLLIAAEHGRTENALIFLESGADPDMQDKSYVLSADGNLEGSYEGHTPLTYAIVSGNVTLVRALLESGADPSIEVVWENAGGVGLDPAVLAGRDVRMKGGRAKFRSESRGTATSLALQSDLLDDQNRADITDLLSRFESNAEPSSADYGRASYGIVLDWTKSRERAEQRAGAAADAELPARVQPHPVGDSVWYFVILEQVSEDEETASAIVQRAKRQGFSMAFLTDTRGDERWSSTAPPNQRLQLSDRATAWRS